MFCFKWFLRLANITEMPEQSDSYKLPVIFREYQVYLNVKQSIKNNPTK